MQQSINRPINRRRFLQQGIRAGAATLATFSTLPAIPAANSTGTGSVRVIEHVNVYSKPEWYGGWPANHGMWCWSQEILVGFVVGKHLDRQGHTIDYNTVRHQFARSLDGGQTWTLEDAYAQGDTAAANNHRLGDEAQPTVDCPGGIDFTQPDFALIFRRLDNSIGPSHFLYTHDRGKSWQGPFKFPQLGTPGIANRTDYIVEGKHELLAFLTVAKSNRREGRVACARTKDGGRTWKRVAWIGPEPEGYAIMPASVRLSPEKLITVIRRKDGERSWLACYVSDDNARTWRPLDDPASNLGRGNPPALIQLQDGRLCLAYGVRTDPARMCVRFSTDEGQSWSDEIVVRGNDGANADIGYPRMVQRDDGRVVLTYYYNHALDDGPPFRYLAATIFDPNPSGNNPP